MRKAEPLESGHRTHNAVKVAFSLVVLILLGLAVFYSQEEMKDLYAEKCRVLAAVGEGKVNQIQQWREQRLIEATHMTAEARLIESITDLLDSPGDETRRSRLAGYLKQGLSDQKHTDALLYDADANLLASGNDDSGPTSDATRTAIRNSLARKRPVFSNLFRAPDGVVRVDIAIPIQDGGGSNIAVLILRFKPSDNLYPLLQRWPSPSQSSETLLVQRDGDGVLVLNDLRQQKDSALSLRIPLSRTEVPAVQAVLGRQGLFEGNDYRGFEVVSDLRPVPGSPWFLVTKMDKEEILSTARDPLLCAKNRRGTVKWVFHGAPVGSDPGQKRFVTSGAVRLCMVFLMQKPAMPPHPHYPLEQVGTSTTSHGLDKTWNGKGGLEGCCGQPMLVLKRNRRCQAGGRPRHRAHLPDVRDHALKWSQETHSPAGGGFFNY